MRILFLLTMLWTTNCLMMEPESTPLFHNDDQVKKLHKAIKHNQRTVVKNMIINNPHLIKCYRQKKHFDREPVAALHVAAAYGFCIKELLTHTADPNITTQVKKNTALHYVQTERGARRLLKAGAHVAQANVNGREPIHCALFGRDFSAVSMKTGAAIVGIAQLLFNAGVDINQKNKTKGTLLHRSIKHGLVYVVDFLLRSGIRTDECDSFGVTPFEQLIKQHSLKQCRSGQMLEVFQKHGTFFFPQMTPALLFCAPWDRLTTADDSIAFLNNWARVFIYAWQKKRDNKPYGSESMPTRCGIMCNQHGCIVKDPCWKDLESYFTPSSAQIIKDTLDAQCKEALALINAGDCEKLENQLKKFPFICSYEEGFSFSMVVSAILHKDAKKGLACLNILLKYQLDSAIIKKSRVRWGEGSLINNGNFLHLAVFCNNPEVINVLMEHHVDYLTEDEHGKTPMSYAVEWKRDNCITALNKLITDRLLITYRSGDYKKSKRLLTQLTDCNVVMNGNGTLLHRMMDPLTVKTNMFIKLLVHQGANPNFADYIGNSPLWSLMRNPFATKDIFETLLNVGARVNLRCNITKKSLLQMATDQKEFELAELFVQHGAIVSKDLLDQEGVPEELNKRLHQKFSERECCSCWEHPDDLSHIPCKEGHEESLCETCYDRIRGEHKKCPMCLAFLDQFELEK